MIEFADPLRLILELLTGTVAKAILALCVAVAGIGFALGRDNDLGGWVMTLAKIALGGALTLLSAQLVDFFF
jgi:type IV secretory pathway VirB2 component (pilin)